MSKSKRSTFRKNGKTNKQFKDQHRTSDREMSIYLRSHNRSPVMMLGNMQCFLEDKVINKNGGR
jgi:hypothetical protein